jgi:hypothetical protein
MKVMNKNFVDKIRRDYVHGFHLLSQITINQFIKNSQIN